MSTSNGALFLSFFLSAAPTFLPEGVFKGFEILHVAKDGDPRSPCLFSLELEAQPLLQSIGLVSLVRVMCMGCAWML